jgi:uroporphyrinogen III methyltransferase/synthase
MKKNKGFVSLVGAGPGDPKLLSLKAKEALEACDVVVYDHLVHPSILNHAPQAGKIYVGKKGGDPDSVSQKSIEKLLLKLVKSGKQVVRLKGGDPFVFGRGGEEALWLKKNKIPFDIIPGITAGIAAAAYAGIPVTHRGLASEVTFITAHEDPKKTESDLNWKVLAQLQGTLVIYMGVKMLPQIIRELLRHGKEVDTPVSVIRWGTTADQQTVLGTLSNIVKKVEEAKLTSPAVTVIGAVNRLRKKLAWFSAKGGSAHFRRRTSSSSRKVLAQKARSASGGEEKPLFGKTVLITRSRKQASQLREALEGQGAHVLEIPTIEIGPITDFTQLDKAIEEMALYQWVVFTSENGAEAFFNRLKNLRKDVRILHGVKIAAIGPGTKAKLNLFSVEPDLIPVRFTTEGLIQALRKTGIRGKRFLLLRTDIAPDLLNRALKESGGEVNEIPVYRTEKPRGLSRKVKEAVCHHPIDFITFTSSSTADHFFEALGNARQTTRRIRPKASLNGSANALWRRRKLKLRVISIGPVTSEAIQKHGVKVTREARVSTISGLVEAVMEEAKKS